MRSPSEQRVWCCTSPAGPSSSTEPTGPFSDERRAGACGARPSPGPNRARRATRLFATSRNLRPGRALHRLPPRLCRTRLRNAVPLDESGDFVLSVNRLDRSAIDLLLEAARSTDRARRHRRRPRPRTVRCSPRARLELRAEFTPNRRSVARVVVARCLAVFYAPMTRTSAGSLRGFPVREVPADDDRRRRALDVSRTAHRVAPRPDAAELAARRSALRENPERGGHVRRGERRSPRVTWTSARQSWIRSPTLSDARSGRVIRIQRALLPRSQSIASVVRSGRTRRSWHRPRPYHVGNTPTRRLNRRRAAQTAGLGSCTTRFPYVTSRATSAPPTGTVPRRDGAGGRCRRPPLGTGSQAIPRLESLPEDFHLARCLDLAPS